MSVTINARITATMLGIEDHGILTGMLYLDYGGGFQSFGGYSFDEPIFDPPGEGTSSVRGEFKGRRGCAFGMEWIRRFLDTLRLEKWEALPGTYVRVRREDEFGGTIEAIGHITEDRWFDPKTIAKEFFPKARL